MKTIKYQCPNRCKNTTFSYSEAKAVRYDKYGEIYKNYYMCSECNSFFTEEQLMDAALNETLNK